MRLLVLQLGMLGFHFFEEARLKPLAASVVVASPRLPSDWSFCSPFPSGSPDAYMQVIAVTARRKTFEVFM